MPRDQDDPIDDKPMPLIDHLLELRQRLLWSIVAFGAAMEGRSYRGPEAVVAWLRDEIGATWEKFEVHPERFERVGDKLLVTGRWHARGFESGVELDIPASWVIEVRDGRIAYWQTYTDHAQARSAVGLED